MDDGGKYHSHSTVQETQFPIAMDISLYGKTRKRPLVDLLYDNGMSISIYQIHKGK